MIAVIQRVKHAKVIVSNKTISEIDNGLLILLGINKTDNGIVGDVAFNEVSKVAKALTPVPGGVGPMTIACLLRNTTIAFKNSC